MTEQDVDERDSREDDPDQLPEDDPREPHTQPTMDE